MKYETPEVVVFATAITAIQTGKAIGSGDSHDDTPAYEDWE